MKRKTNVKLNDRSSYALRPQPKLGQYDFPFTLNPIVGCFMGCKYCFSPSVVYGYQPNRRELFFTNAIIQLDKAEHLDKELLRYSILPEHMKRVQVNEISEYYQPQIINYLQSDDQPDLMANILEVFKKHFDNGNCWMVHILTKSHLILNHSDLLKDMKEQIQVEISFATRDDKISRSLEFFTPDVSKRLEVVEKLSDVGIFVRVMAMPFYGDKKDLLKLKKETFKRGAKAFKNKGLNYFKDWDELRQVETFDEFLDAKLSTGKGRVDEKVESLIINSGEYALNENGNHRYKTVLVPRMDENFKAMEHWGAITLMDERFERRRMKVIDCGYKDCNKLDWGYII
jgi:DNA repair photolyase